MSDMVVYIPFHGYDDDDSVYVSWLDAVYYVADKDLYAFKLVTTSGGSTYLQWTEDITSGFIREVDSSSGTTTIVGLDYLEGENVYVTSGGEIVGLFAVENGSVSVPNILFTYQVGLPYKMKVRTMRLSMPQEGNTFQTRIKRIHETVVRYIRSKYGRAGQEYDGIEYLTDLDTTFSTSSRDDTKPTKGGFSEDSYTVITSDKPVPFTLLATIISFEVEERR